MKQYRCSKCGAGGHYAKTCRTTLKKKEKRQPLDDVRDTIRELDALIAVQMREVEEHRFARDQLIRMFGVDIAIAEGWEL